VRIREFFVQARWYAASFRLRPEPVAQKGYEFVGFPLVFVLDVLVAALLGVLRQTAGMIKKLTELDREFTVDGVGATAGFFRN